RVGQQYVARALAIWRHPEKHIELAVSGFDERMRLGRVDRLARQDMDGFWIVGGDGVVRQVHVEYEGPNICHPPTGVQVLGDCERNCSSAAGMCSRPKSVAVFNGHSEP